MVYKFDEKYKKNFWSHVDILDKEKCWEWKLSKNIFGYGRVRYKNTMTIASRIAYAITDNEIPDGLFVCHHCDNRSCCNPNHLFLGTIRDNVLDMEAKGRARHPFGEKLNSSLLKDCDILKIREMYSKRNITAIKLAELFNVCDSTIINIVNGKTWKYSGGVITKIGKGGKRTRGHTKLKEKDVIEIKKILKTTNLTQKEVGNLFNVSERIISDIKSDRTWKDIN